MEYIILLENVFEQGEKLKGYWDETGLDMHIAVKRNGMIAVSTKHWSRVHYISTKLSPDRIWECLGEISEDIGRKFIKSKKGNYVYINKLSNDQTQNVFNKFKEIFGNNITRVWEYSWDIEDSYLP